MILVVVNAIGGKRPYEKKTIKLIRPQLNMEYIMQTTLRAK